jgi:hypothetical protein
MEISAAAAPRPQILVGATGDWTRATLTVEGPALEKIYALFNQTDRLRYVRFDFNHNYNKTSREAVYEFFGKWLLHAPDPSALKEVAYTKEPDAALRVFPDGKLPADAVTEEALTAYLIQSATNELNTYAPINPPLLERYRKNMIPLWKRSLQVDFIERGLMVQPGRITKAETYTASHLALGRAGKTDHINATLITPRRDTLRTMVVLAHPEGRAPYVNADGSPKGLARLLIDKGVAVLTSDLFQPDAAADKKRDYSKDFFTGYNRTDVQERVQDLVTLCAFAQTQGKGRMVVLHGAGRAGLWAMLAAPACDAIAADCAQFDSSNDQSFLARDIFSPGLRKLGGFEGVVAMNTGNDLLLHNTGSKFSTAYLKRVYKGMHTESHFIQETNAMPDEKIADWVAGLKSVR